MRRLLVAATLALALGQGTTPTTPAQCAQHLGITYSSDQGATERLDAFQACTERTSR